MPTQKDTWKDRLSRYREVTITVTGRKSGRKISNPVWFVYEDGKLYLLPVQGSDTQWYKNVLKNPKMAIDAHGKEAQIQAVPINDTAQVKSVVDNFRAKYGAGDVKKYIPTSTWRLSRRSPETRLTNGFGKGTTSAVPPWIAPNQALAPESALHCSSQLDLL